MIILSQSKKAQQKKLQKKFLKVKKKCLTDKNSMIYLRCPRKKAQKTL